MPALSSYDLEYAIHFVLLRQQAQASRKKVKKTTVISAISDADKTSWQEGAVDVGVIVSGCNALLEEMWEEDNDDEWAAGRLGGRGQEVANAESQLAGEPGAGGLRGIRSAMALKACFWHDAMAMASAFQRIR
jgi:hypothetical protein